MKITWRKDGNKHYAYAAGIFLGRMKDWGDTKCITWANVGRKDPRKTVHAKVDLNEAKALFAKGLSDHFVELEILIKTIRESE